MAAPVTPPEPAISRNVVVLGWVSFLNDLASETIYPLLPLFLVNVLGADKAVLGIIEGIAESTASLVKLGSGWLADRIRHYKWLAVLGYGISALARPLYAFVGNAHQVLTLRFADRLGKGIRTVPRDLIIAESTTEGHHGRAFGLQRAMDNAGAVLGPLAAFWLLPHFHGRYQNVFVTAAIPGLLALLLLIFVLKPTPSAAAPAVPPALTLQGFSPRLRLFLVAVFVFALGNSSNAFLILRTQNLGVAALMVPLVYLVFNLVAALISLPAGVLSDRIGRPRVLLMGYLTFTAIYLGFAFATHAWQAWLLFAGYGLYTGACEGVERAWIGDLAPEQQRGAAFGFYHAAVGIAALPASLAAGALWDRFGATTTFTVDAGLAAVAILLFLISWRLPGENPPGS